MQIFTINPSDNTITDGITIREYNINEHKLLGVDVGIFDKPNSNVLKIFNVYDSKADDVVTELDPIFKPVKYHPDRSYLSAARISKDASEEDEALVYFNASVPETRANLFNTKDLYNNGKLYSGKVISDKQRVNRQGETYYHESTPAVIIVKKDTEYKYATFLGKEKHIVTFKYSDKKLTIVDDTIAERKPRPKPVPHTTMGDALVKAIKQSASSNMWTSVTEKVTVERTGKRNKKKNKWEVNRKESRWN
jgi:hypothetical protein